MGRAGTALRGWAAILPLCGLLAACGGGGAPPVDVVSAPPPVPQDEAPAPPPLPQDEAPAPPSDPGDEAPVPPPAPGDETSGPPVGSEPQTVTLGRRTVQLSAAPSGVIEVPFPPIRYERSTDTIRFVGADLQRAVNDLLPAGFAFYNNVSESTLSVIRGETSGGEAIVVRYPGMGDVFAYRRLADTEMPTAGSGTFTGSYAGVLGNFDRESRGTIVGNVIFEVNFDARSLSGEIKDRINQNGRRFDDLTLREAGIDDQGAFKAGTSGGRSPFLGHTSARGTHEGLVVGATGGGIVGSVRLVHTGSPGFVDLYENGAFVAERQ